MAKDGAVLANAEFAGGAGVGAGIADQVRDEDVARLLTEGYTAVLQAVHRLWPPVGELARGLAAALGHPVQVNAYVTPPGAQGFSTHYDTHDVFVLQLSGGKSWTIHPPVIEHPLSSDGWTHHREAIAARSAEEPLLNVRLGEGDCLYLPAGFLHAALAQQDWSTHLTFGVHALRRRDLLRFAIDELMGQADQDARWRKPLSPGWASSVRDHVSEIVKDAGSLLHDVDVEAVASAWHAQNAIDHGRPSPLAPIAQASAAMAPDTVRAVCIRPGLHVTLHEGPEPWLQTATRSIPLQHSWLPAISHLVAAGRIVTTAELAGLGLDDADRASLLATLLREGIAVQAVGERE